MTDLERRRARRYKLIDSVDYWWLAPDGSVQAGHGMTLDISSSGVMVIARKCPPEGARIQTTIRVDRCNGSNRPLELQGEGVVVRVEPGEGIELRQRMKGFAASLHLYSELWNDSEKSNRDYQDTSKRRNTFTADRVDDSGWMCTIVSRSPGSEL